MRTQELTWLGAEPVTPPVSVGEAVEYLRANKVDIRVKTCLEYVSTGNKRYPYRVGMFTIDADEYEAMIDAGGFYLFIVFDDKTGKTVIKAELVPACDFSFRRQLSWRDVFGD